MMWCGASPLGPTNLGQRKPHLDHAIVQEHVMAAST
jgi:hypothetical protein